MRSTVFFLLVWFADDESTAPNVTGAVVLLILAFSSDFARIRFPFIAVGFLLPVIGALFGDYWEVGRNSAYSRQ